MIYNIIVAPIEALVGWIFLFIVNKISSLGVIGAICGVSVAINILALPLYNIAESIQEKEREINKKLEPRVKRIKKGFKGDEQFMMLSEYYRQNGYHPLYALRGSLSILIEIPFFIAAYKYLSSSEILKESSFWIFSNLGEADRMFSLALGSLVIPINILPIIMTAINFVSGYIYTKGSTKRDKIQLYAMGLFFLVLLYNSPSGLVIYWILNNIFSLVKTIVLKLFKHPGRVLHAFISVGLLAGIYVFRNENRKMFLLFTFFAVIFVLFPYILKIYNSLKCKLHFSFLPPPRQCKRNYFTVVLFSGLALALLCGFLLPSSTISSSPEEFSFIGNISNPTYFVWSTLWFFIGLFVFWPLVVYKMFGDEVKRWEATLIFTVFVIALLDAFVFNCDYGTLTNQFIITNTLNLEVSSLKLYLGPFVSGACAFLLFLSFDYYGKSGIISLLSLSIAIGELVIGMTKMRVIDKRFDAYKATIENNQSSKKDDDEEESIYSLSKDGKNVVVIFLDRAIGCFFPYALDQYEELQEQFKGFTYYPNTVSYSECTDLASPSMMGGYEYTPEEMNSRDGLLKDLHNEASLVAPTLFLDAGYSVTVTDPPFPNYSWRGDLSGFSSIVEEGAKVEEVYDKFVCDYCDELKYLSGLTDEEAVALTKNGAVNFSILQILPKLFKNTFYYNCFRPSGVVYPEVLYWLSDLYYLDQSTSFDADGNTYTFIENELTHNPTLLDKELLLPASEGDEAEHNLPSPDENGINHYSVFCAALKQIGRWLDYLRENECYDNTRIIIVSDHGRAITTGITSTRVANFMPLLLVKDFNSNDEIKTDESFMTNADTIFLAKDGLDEVSNINPYTGEELAQQKDGGVNIYTSYPGEYNAPILVNRTQFTLEKENAFHVYGNMFDEANWIPLLEWEEMNK